MTEEIKNEPPVSQEKEQPRERIREVHHHHYHEKKSGRFYFGRFFLGVLIVLAGVIYLAANYGIPGLNFNIDWARIWPIILIFVGLSLLTARSWWGKLIGIVAAVVLIVFALAALFGPDLWRFASYGEDIPTPPQHISIARDPSAKTAAIILEAGAGEISIQGGAKDLIEGSFLSNVMNLDLNSAVTADIQQVTLKEKMRDGTLFPLFGTHYNNLTLSLNNKVPVDFGLKVGAANIDINLTDVMARTVAIKSGAAKLNLTLGDKLADSDVSIESGASSVLINLPRSVGAKIELHSGMASTQLPGFVKTGDSTYESPDYNGAKKKIDLVIKLGVSSLFVSRY